jgi:hypothetical protein
VAVASLIDAHPPSGRHERSLSGEASPRNSSEKCGGAATDDIFFLLLLLLFFFFLTCCRGGQPPAFPGSLAPPHFHERGKGKPEDASGQVPRPGGVGGRQAPGPPPPGRLRHRDLAGLRPPPPSCLLLPQEVASPNRSRFLTLCFLFSCEVGDPLCGCALLECVCVAILASPCFQP